VAQMAQYFGVSCDYLVGFSNFRSDKKASFSVGSVGLTEDTIKFFAGLKHMATSAARTDREKFDALGFDCEKEALAYNMAHAQRTLDLLNALISHDIFGVLLQYIKNTVTFVTARMRCQY
jgi:hypothetical protein